MEAANTIALAGFAFVLLVQAAAIVWWARGVSTTQAVHSKALEALPDLFKSFVTVDVGKGYQAQLDRLEHRDAEHEGKVSAIRQEAADRVERISARVSAHEQATSAANTALANALTKLEVTMAAMREGMAAMKESIDRLSEAERARPTAQPLNAIEQLHMLVEVQGLLKKIA